MTIFAGADGCRGGWAVARIQDDVVSLLVLPNFAAVVAATADAELLLVDIPVGLVEGGTEGRLADREARGALKPLRHNSVFTVPCRAAVHIGSYPEALALNRAATGKGLSKQAFCITPKIAEVDLLMRADPSLQARIRESHPEVCLAALNGAHPMTYYKKTPAGRAERLALLAQFLPNAADVLSRPFAGAAPDDLVDALTLAVSARTGAACGLRSLPAEPSTDPYGLRMEIVCPAIAKAGTA